MFHLYSSIFEVDFRLVYFLAAAVRRCGDLAADCYLFDFALRNDLVTSPLLVGVSPSGFSGSVANYLLATGRMG